MRAEVAGRLAALAAAVDGVAECPGLGLPAEELTELLRGVFREGNRLEAAFTSLVGALDRLEQERLNGQGVCQAWLAGGLHLSDGAAYGRVRLARSLPSRPKTAFAFEQGAIGFSHAVTVTRTLDQVEAGGTEPELAESALLEQAVECDPGQLRDFAKDLRHRLNPRGVALLNWKTPISGEMVRRIATDAELIPMLVDQQGNPLWLGRRRRTSTDKQFLALMHRDRRCRWPGCNREADRCQGHHRTPWSKGGETNLEDLALFCPYHHTLWTEGHRPKRLPDGRVITVPPGENLRSWFGPAVAERPPPACPHPTAIAVVGGLWRCGQSAPIRARMHTVGGGLPTSPQPGGDGFVILFFLFSFVAAEAVGNRGRPAAGTGQISTQAMPAGLSKRCGQAGRQHDL